MKLLAVPLVAILMAVSRPASAAALCEAVLDLVIDGPAAFDPMKDHEGALTPMVFDGFDACRILAPGDPPQFVCTLEYPGGAGIEANKPKAADLFAEYVEPIADCGLMEIDELFETQDEDGFCMTAIVYADEPPGDYGLTLDVSACATRAGAHIVIMGEFDELEW